MCCLTYEHEYYQKMKKSFPKIGKKVMTNYGEGKVIRQSVLRETVTVALESGQEVEVQVEDLKREGLLKRKSKKRSERQEIG
jgi:cell fate regulator YaaT (PSP1 superfamily)